MKRAISASISAILLATILVAGSCRTAKEAGVRDYAVSPVAGKELYKFLLSEIPDYDRVSIKCLFTMGKLSSRGQVRMIKDRFVQVSLQPVLGIEMLRVMLTPDSIYIMDRINGIAAAEATKTLASALPGGVGITQVQNLLLGAPFTLTGNISENDYEKFRWKETGAKTIMQTPAGEYPELEFTINNIGELEQTAVSDGKGNMLKGTYAARKSAETAGTVPRDVSVTILIPSKIFAIELGMKEIAYDWNKTFEPDTEISKRYTRITFDDFIKTYIK